MTGRKSLRAAAAGLSLALAGFLGCGLFEPRDPKVGGDPGVICLTPNTPSAVVANVTAHYASSPGLTCYTSMLDSAFAFHPDVADSIDSTPDIFLNWNRDIESRVATNLARDATSRSVTFDSFYASPSTSPDGRTQVQFWVYHLIVKAPQAAPDTLFRGFADITFFQGASGGQWHITTWVDRRDTSGARTWGYLRSLYRVGF